MSNSTAPAARPVRLIALGDLLGSLSYLGACARCRGQFMSTHERVSPTPAGCLCAKCAAKGA